MKKLNWKRLLGFDQLRTEGDRAALANSRIGGKIGDKGCVPVRPIPEQVIRD
jgi:hypothetical protein